MAINPGAAKTGGLLLSWWKAGVKGESEGKVLPDEDKVILLKRLPATVIPGSAN